MTAQSPRNDLEWSEGDRQELTVPAEPGALPSVVNATLPVLRAGEGVCKGRGGDRGQEWGIYLLKLLPCEPLVFGGCEIK